MIDPLIVLTTIGNADQGRRIARELVEARLAACVTCFPSLISFYRWSGRVEEDSEMLLMIKTTGERLEELKAQLLRVHPYEVPEFLVLQVRDGGHPYLRWLAEATGQASGQSTGQSTDQAPGHAPGHAPGQSTGQSTDQATGHAPGHATGDEIR